MSETLIPSLRAELSTRGACLTLCQSYLRLSPEPKIATVLVELAEKEQEMIYLLAKALRTADEVVGDIQAEQRIVQQGRLQRAGQARLDFLAVEIQDAVARFKARVTGEADPEQRVLWEELFTISQAQLTAIETAGSRA
jgi:hypothetical protein